VKALIICLLAACASTTPIDCGPEPVRPLYAVQFNNQTAYLPKWQWDAFTQWADAEQEWVACKL
jgi:hypothetical protein